MPVIDLIVTHYNEPWETGKKFFDMLAMQRNVDFSDFSVLVVQDGDENILPWDDIRKQYPYNIRDITIMGQNSGPSEARNHGIMSSTADWIMFCDFDDMFTNVYSMSMILNVFPAYDEDVLWMSALREEKRGSNFVNKLDENFSCTFAKLYRRKALIDNNITFNTSFLHHYESMFNNLVLYKIPAHRIKRLSVQFETYTKTLRPDGYNSSEYAHTAALSEMLLENIVMTNTILANDEPNAQSYALDALFDAYYILNMQPVIININLLSEVKSFAKHNRQLIESADNHLLDIAMTNASSKISAFVQTMYNHFGTEFMPPPDSMHIALDWISSVIYGINKTKESSRPERNQNERIVVYCGTRNTYENMVTSAKSLLSHTSVDKIYFFTEDDTFPNEIPDIITNINVSNQTFFDQNGPNYKNSWTYMCMMRAAFAKLLPQHDRILSLDIDVAIEDDISDLFSIDMSGAYLAGVPETARSQHDYINFGVVMMNLAKIRIDHIDDKVIDSLNSRKWDCPEQSCFNEFCKNHILLLSSDFNSTPHSTITAHSNNPRIIHYAGIKYWKYFTPYRYYAKKSWDEIIPRNRKRVAVYSGTKSVYKMMCLSAKSLLAHTKVDRIYFLIEDDDFPEPLPDCITCINISSQEYFTHDGPNFNSLWTYMTLFKSVLPVMFPIYDTILSLDCDTIIREDISYLWNLDLSKYYIAAVPETHDAPHRDISPYFNAGVMLMNVKKLNEDGIPQKAIDLLNTQRFEWAEQDALNRLCKGKILSIPSAFNAFHCTDPTDTVFIRHYVGPENYKRMMLSEAKQYENISWNEILGKEIENNDGQ